MTGQVKEEIITRWAELGLFARDGEICFDPVLLREDEFLTRPETFEYVSAVGERRTLQLVQGTLAFTRCQTPFVLHLATDERVEVRFADGTMMSLPDHRIGPELSREIFMRTGKVARVDIFVDIDGAVGARPASPAEAGLPVAGGDGP
jgi:hypothetical protein